MALHTLIFDIPGIPGATIAPEWSHSGVTGSGDMEVLLERKPDGGKVAVKVVTPVRGFDLVWQKVMERFVADSGVGDLSIEINDNNATPFIVTLRMQQALAEAGGVMKA